MGYDFRLGATKSDIIADLTRHQNFTVPETTVRDSVVWTKVNVDRTCVARCVRGSILWTVQVDIFTNPDGDSTVEKWIGCYILANSKGFGWGYKSLSEASGPFYYTCPLSYFDLVPDVVNQSWRDKVVAYHARTNTNRLSIGDRVALVGSTLEWVKISSIRPLRGVGNDGRYYRIPKSMLGEILEN